MRPTFTTGGAVAALQQERLAGRNPPQRLFQAARLAGKDQRREGRELLFDVGQHPRIRVFGHLGDRLQAPIVGRPPFGHVNLRNSPTALRAAPEAPPPVAPSV
jgi:hypothetical protein